MSQPVGRYEITFYDNDYDRIHYDHKTKNKNEIINVVYCKYDSYNEKNRYTIQLLFNKTPCDQILEIFEGSLIGEDYKCYCLFNEKKEYYQLNDKYILMITTLKYEGLKESDFDDSKSINSTHTASQFK